MKKTKIGLASIVGSLFFFSALLSHSTDFIVTPPPESMDKYYSESGKPSEWVEQMQTLSSTFAAIFISLDRKEWEHAEKRAAVFIEAYQKASEMIPEWERDFDLKAANQLKESIQTKDIKKLDSVVETLRKTCSHCHSKNKTSVWVQYRWPSTKTIKVLDPISEIEMSYEKFMEGLSDSLKRIVVNFEQEEYQPAWKSIDVFSKRLTSLRSVCSKCHVTEWTKSSVSVKDFFVGNDILDVLHEIKKEFATGEPSKQKFREGIDYINKRSCKMCHLVHQPAAAIQQAWKQKK